MKKIFLLIAPLSMLALAACNKSETPTADADGEVATTAEATAPLPPAITKSGVYRCADNTILNVDFLGANEAANIYVGDKNSTPIHVTAPKAEASADGAAPAADAAAKPMKSEDGATSLSISGTDINVKLADKGAQTCKGK